MESKKKLTGRKETNNYIVIYSSVNRRIRPQEGVMIWIHKSIKNTISATQTEAKK
jgi:hypothetical protein